MRILIRTTYSEQANNNNNNESEKKKKDELLSGRGKPSRLRNCKLNIEHLTHNCKLMSIFFITVFEQCKFDTN
jgi:hypothetical protein